MIHSNHPFYLFYSEIYGPRWPSLLKSLSDSEKQVIRLNVLSQDFRTGELLKKFFNLVPFNELENCFERDPAQLIKPERTSDGLLDCYIMDPASVFVARNLEVQSHHRILDMCAAPGGKSLVLLENGLISSGELITNEPSSARRETLLQIIRQYVPLEVRHQIWVKGKDGSQFGMTESQSFDRVLVDAPCSGERHLLERPQLLEDWSIKRSKNLSIRQYSLISSGWNALKEEGILVYSTCSVSPFENDGVVGKLLKKKKEQIELLSPRLTTSFMEKTEFGYQFFPDHSGYGPIYFSIIKKRAQSSP